MKFSPSNVVAVVGALLVGIALGGSSVEPGVVTQYLEVTPREMHDRIRDLEIERDGLQARLRGVSELNAETVFITDTLVLPPDTVIQTVRLTDGELRYATLSRVDSMYAPEIRVVPFNNCDDGLSISGASVVCDRARLGHLYLFGSIVSTTDPLSTTLRPQIGAWWQPSYRSSWRVYTATDGSSVEVGFWKGWKLF